MATVFTLDSALFNDFGMLPLTRQGLTWQTTDILDDTGEHTGWWIVKFDDSGTIVGNFHFIDGIDEEHLDDVRDAADLAWVSIFSSKRINAWTIDSNGNSYCYIV